MNSMPPDYERKALNERAIRVLIRETVTETLATLGIDTREPAELRADLDHLRRLRRVGDDTRAVLRRAALTLAASSVLCLLWEALRHQLLSQG